MVLAIQMFKAALRRKSNPRDFRSLESTILNYRADLSKLESFYLAMKEPNHGYLPLSWIYLASFKEYLRMLTDTSFPYPIVGLIHLKNIIRQIRPVGAGETLSIHCKVEPGMPHSKGQTFYLLSQAKDKNDRLVLENLSEILYKATTLSSNQMPQASVLESETYFHKKSIEVTKKDAYSYALISSDFNPIHLSDLAARAFGFQKAIMHGMWILSKIISINHEFLRDENVEIKCEFKKPIYIPATILYEELAPKTDKITFRVRQNLLNQINVTGQISKNK